MAVRVSIRYQILVLLVGVVAIALTAFLVLAVRLFSRDQLAYVYELEVSLTTTLAEEVRASLVGRVDKLGYFAVQSARDPDAAARALLATDPDLLSVEVWQRQGGPFARVLQQSDPERLAQLDLSTADLEEARRTAPVPFDAVEAEGTLLQNASLPPDVALLSLAAAPPGTSSVVVALFRPDRLLHIFGRTPSYRAYLVDGQGRVVVDPDPGRVLAHESDAALPLVQEAIRGKVARAVREFDGPQGATIGAFARVGVGRLAVVAEIPRADALSATGALQRRSVLFAVAILFVAVIASVALGRRLTAPLRRLEQATRVVAEGDRHTPVEIAERNEIGSLAESFNRMAEAVADREARLSLAHQELMEAERLSILGEISAGVVHEVKNPITSIVGYAALGQDSATPEQMRECLKTIEEAGWRAHEILAGLLEFAHTEEVDLQAVAVSEVILDTLRLLKHQMGIAGVEVETELADDLPPVKGNRGQLQQVLVNLMVNAAHAMEKVPDRRLTVRTALHDGQVTIALADTGSGIAAEIMERLFTPFFTTKGRGKGTGLGLSVSQRIVHRFGGEIRVASQLGVGSTFTIRLAPATAAEASPERRLA